MKIQGWHFPRQHASECVVIQVSKSSEVGSWDNKEVSECASYVVLALKMRNT